MGLFPADAGVSAAAAGDEETTADDSTLTGYEAYLVAGETSTQNIGRIWTDKTVQNGDITLSGDIGDAGKIKKGDSDFLVGLSALSSMSSITNEEPKPLDIVLLLDMSGSMSKSFDENDPYEEINGRQVDPNSGITYYVKKQNGEYQYLSRYANRWYYYEKYDPANPQPTYVSPLGGSGEDTKVQFYVDKDPKINALKEAVDSFVDATAAENDKIEDANSKHRISVVKFSGDISTSIGNETGKTQIVSDFAAYGTNNARDLKDTIDSLRPSGATRADYGMQLAQDQIGQANRSDSKKVVIFFTDGEPNSGTGFVDDIANSAIKDASAMNSEGTIVYTVGVFKGANANQTNWQEEPAGKFNAYMNAMSSKYPHAESYKNLGDRVGTREYYKVAEDKKGLAQVFQEIASELKTELSESPVAGGAGDEQGYITFSDELGQYMEVDSFKSIVFAGQQFTKKEEKTAGNVTTYTFEGQIKDTTGIYSDGDLNEIIIQVEKDPANLAQGDKVTVKIPANLIPLRNYSASVSKDGVVSDFKVSEAYPIRVFYGVSLKDKAAEAIENGTADSALQAYIKANTTKTTDGAGKEHDAVSFLSNLYEKNKTGISGSTTAQFTPAETNTYYYVDVNTPLYVDKDCKIKLTEASYNDSKTDTLYYKQSFYQQGVNHLQEEVVAFPIATFAEGASGFVDGNEQDGYYLKAGSPRLSRIREFEDKKGETIGSTTLGKNNTDTAELVANPNWNSQRADASYITVQLGNNGKLVKELPGTLKVSKTVTADDGLSTDQFKDVQFPFEISIPEMAGKKVQAQVVATNGGEAIGDPFTFTFDEAGKRTQSLKDGETLVITGLDDGAAYTVTEGAPLTTDGAEQKGFKQTAPADDNGAATPATGTISSAAVETAAFTNNYSVNPITVSDAFKGEKRLMNREWLEGDKFTFVIDNHNVEGTPLPKPSKITLTKADADKVDGGEGKAVPFAFEGVQYTKPGVYEYDMYEDADAAATRLPGVTYTNANYHVTVQITDNGQGELESKVTVKRDAPDLGDDGAEGDISEGRVATFTNVYDEQTIASAPQGSKEYTNNGDKPFEDGMFTFKVTPIDGAPMPEGYTPADDDPGSAIVTHKGNTISMPQPTFDNSVNGAQYSYRIQEVIPSGANADNGYTVDGMTYDSNVYTATVTITVDEHGVPNAAWKYYNADGSEVKDPKDENKAASRLYFYNSYTPASATASIKGSKTLTGRDMKTDVNDAANNETFGFTLTATAATQAKGGFELPANLEEAVSGGAKDQPVSFDFDNITFTKPGTYVFNVNETKWNGEALPTDGSGNVVAQDGLTFDTHTSTVTIEVKDDGKGKLYVAADGVKYNNGANAATDKAAFTNKYETSTTFTGIDVTKTMTGRAMTVGEFSFAITPANDNAQALGVPTGSNEFSNTLTSRNQTFAGKLSGLKFTQEDAGKTFDYIVDETNHNDDGTGSSTGVTYDTSRYYVSIDVQDNGNGSLTATPTIRKADANGNPTGDALSSVAFTNTYDAAASDEVTPTMNKRLDGRSWTAEDSFTFKIEKDSATGASGVTDRQAWDAMPLPEPAEVTVADKGGTASGTNVPFDFGSLSFTKAGKYIYKVTEAIPDDATNENVKGEDGNLIAYKDATPDQQKQAGWKKDGLTYTNYVTTITINVTDSGTGKLQVGQPAVSTGLFVNRYASSQTLDDAVNFKLTKTLNGRGMRDGQFKFKVEAVGAGDGSATAAETAIKIGISEDGSTTSAEVFGKGGADGTPVEMFAGNQQMKFDQTDSGKKFVVKFSEVQKTAEEAPGYTYDQTVYQMEVTPTDNGNGTMTIHTVLRKIKDAKGNPVAEGEQVVLDKTWNGGDKDDLSVDFVNSYAAEGTLTGATDLKGTKKIDGPWAGNKADFKFSIKQVADKSGAELGENDVRAVLPNPAEATSDADGNFNFGDITFTKPGTYYFQVEESAGLNGKGWTNSTEKKIVKVTVTEADTGNGNGKLVATKDESSDKLTFTNKYAQTESAAYVPQVIKQVAGHAANAEQFEFKLEAADQATKDAIKDGDIKSNILKGETTSETQKNAAAIADNDSATISFAGMTFTKASPEDGYTFKVTESHKDDDNEKLDGVQNAGWTMDTHEYTIKITVTDENSQLVAHAVDENGKTFSNTFGAATTLGENGGLKVTKQLTGRDLEQDQFNFTVKATEGAENHDAAADKLTKIEGVANGVLSFKNSAPNDKGVAEMKQIDGLAFDQSDIGKTFSYTVSEVDEEAAHPGYTYDKESATVAITVHEGESGKIYTTTVVTKGDKATTYKSGKTAEVPFENSYAAEGAATITASKTLTGRTMKADEFTFGIVAKGGKTDGTEDVATGTNGADGNIAFSAINYTADGLDKLAAKDNSYVEKTEVNGRRAWTVSYTAYEKTPLPAGVTAKTNPIDFTVTVVDEGSGHLSATANVPESGLAFENVYGGDSAKVAIAGKKVLAGDASNKPDIAGKYTFTIVKSDGAPITNGDEDFKNEATNDKDGKVTFPGKLVYTMDDFNDVTPDENGVRTKDFTYTVTEKAADEVGVPGVTTDGEKTVTVTLKDDGKGNLTATVSSDPDFTFTNTYAPEAAAHAPVVKKELKGDRGVDLQAGEFSFEMSVAAKDGSPKDGYTQPEKTTATNKADGTVTFDNISFTKEGTYTVTIHEQVPVDGDKAPYVEYDEHSYSYDVVVTSNGTGKLQIEAKGAPTDKEATFTNTYNKPKQEKNAYSGDGTELKTNINGQMVGVGDLITYKIDWFNDAVNPETGASAAAKIVVTDNVPAGTEFVSASDGGQLVNGVVTWNLNEQAPGAHGTVAMTVRVLDSAVSVDKIANQAIINIGGHDAKTDEVTNFIPKKTVGEGKPTVEGDIQVGDQLTYIIEWANTTGKEADVVITDKLSDGLTFVKASDGGALGKDGHTVTWNLKNQAAGAKGKVTVTVQVNEKAVVPGADNSNKATINVGNSSNVITNTVPGPQLQTGNLTISKTVVSSDAGVDAPAQDFTFNVELKDKNGDPLKGEYNFTGTSDGAAGYTGTVSNGGTIVLKDKGAVTIEGLPEGATYKVVEATPEGWTASFGNAGDHGTITADGTANVAVTNTYKPGSITLPGADNLKVQKVMDGDRDWLADEKYTFEISAVNPGDAPMPEPQTLELGKPAKGKTQSGNFGNIAFTQTGTYEYKIVEKGTSVDSNLTFSQAEYKVVVTVGKDATDPSKLAVSSVMTQVKNDQGETTETAVNNSTAVFTNTYTKPEQKKDVFAGSDVDDLKTSINGQLVGVGDEITYKIDWVNNAVNDKGEAAAATVVVTDEVPQGTELVASSDGGQKQEDGSVVWNLGEQPANASGSVTMTVKVTDDAVDVDKIKNTAEIKIGDNDPEQTNEVENDFPRKTVQTPTEGSVKVGDILTYTVEWANTTGQTADVVVNDTFMAGLQLLTGEGDYVVTGADPENVTFEAKSAPVVGGPSTTTATVTIKDVEPGASGTVVFKAKVTEGALSVDKITNTATITVGDKSTVTTNTTTTPAPKTGDLIVTKTVTAGEGAEVDNSKEFDFTVTAKDASNNNLNGTYGKLTFVDGKATFKLKNGGEEKITGLPEGTQYTVTETAADGYTTTATGDTGTIAAGKEAKADFVNTYSSAVPADKPVTVNGLLTKRFTGRTWNVSDEFTFKIEAKDPTTAPMPEKTEVTVKGDGQSETQPIDFGTINFTFDDIKDVAPDENGKRTKTFTYEVYEVVPEDAAKIPGVTYDTHRATITVTLTDNGDGTMGGSSKITAITRAVNNEFHNVYTTDVDYAAVTGIDLQKTLTGRDMTDGQFAFTLSNFSDGAAEKLGLSDAKNAYTVKAAKSGEASIIDLFAGKTLTFTDGDAGNTYTFDVTETKVGGTGYTNDTAARHVAIAVTYDEAAGVLTVTTTVTKDGESQPVAQTVVTSETGKGDRAVIPFANSYEASTENPGGTAATIEATKSLTGRPLEDGEFAFTLTGPGLDDAGKTVRNQGDKVSFGAFNYTSSDLEAMVNGTTVKRITTEDGKRGWELSYTVTESTDGFSDKGLTAERQSFNVTVTVVDNGDGTLTATVAYPAESEGGNVFKNVYNTDEVTLSLSGKKVLEHASNLTPNSIEGKFTFTITDEAGNVIATAKNDANGNVSFKDVLTYTLESFNKEFGAAEDEGVDAQAVVREHIYTYYVEETGSAPGVTNDAITKKTIQVKVTDDGEGHLTAEVVKDDQALDFTFTNTYAVQPVDSSITDQLSIGKTIDGREMQAGEFDFVLVDAAGNTVAAGDNDQAGTSSTVTFTPIQFTEPGEYDYTVRELNSGKGGVSYDSTSYQAHASVKDNGDGTLSVTWTVSKGDEPVTEGVVFNNTYEAKPTSIAFNAAKVLTGRDLKAGEFSFQLLEDGKMLQTVKNGVDGDAAAIKFDTITYDEVGEHDYEIAEVKGDDATITYDKATFTYHVSVTDDGNGSLVAIWTAGENGDPVFRNVYTEPAKPEKPEKPNRPELPQMGDPVPPTGVLATIAAFGTALMGGGVALFKRRR